jgi:hypothetical protein
MPEEKKPAAPAKPKKEEKPKKAEKSKKEAPPVEDSTLVSVAKAVGTAAGKLAVQVGIEKTPSKKIPKLAPKNKKRVPRRQKKALQKTTASRV